MVASKITLIRRCFMEGGAEAEAAPTKGGLAPEAARGRTLKREGPFPRNPDLCSLLYSTQLRSAQVSQLLSAASFTSLGAITASSSSTSSSHLITFIGTNSVKTTVTQIFKQQLFVLADVLENSERHYVRCIKPNDEKRPNVFHPVKVLQQLKWHVTHCVNIMPGQSSQVKRKSCQGFVSPVKESVK